MMGIKSSVEKNVRFPLDEMVHTGDC